MWVINIEGSNVDTDKQLDNVTYDTFVTAQQAILSTFPNVQIVSTSEFRNGSEVLKIKYV